jgi:uncharacterized protein
MKKIFFLTCFLISQCAVAQREIPPLWGHHVHDDAHILSPSTIDNLEVMLVRHEDSTSNQIAIYIISSLEGEPIEQLSLRVAHDEWKLGQAKNDNGVLLLIAVDDRKMRIEVGQGLEGALTDARCSQIIRNEIAPHFRSERYDEGVTSAITAIIASIAGEYKEGGSENAGEASGWELFFYGLFVFGILGVFTVIGLFTPGCGGWFLYAFLIPFYATFPMFILGGTVGTGLLGTYIVGMPIAKVLIGRSGFGKRMASRMGKGGGSGGWSTGSGWSSGSWGSGGGGFSGGGGSFGGGGSSGSW